MDSWDWMGLLSLVMLAVISAALLWQSLQLGRMKHVVERYCEVREGRQQRIRQQAELHSALRAEKEHVAQLLRKVEILQAMLPVR